VHNEKTAYITTEATGVPENSRNKDNSVVGQRDSVYLGKALLMVPNRLVVWIKRGDQMDMGELLPEFWAPGEDSSGRGTAEELQIFSVGSVISPLTRL